MRPTLLPLCVALALLGAQGAASAAAPVTAVKLYPGGATVVRSAQVAPGATEVVFAGLPANFKADTLRVQTSNGVRVGEVITEDAASAEVLNPAEAALSNRIEALRDQKAVLDAESKSAEIVRNYLQRYNGAPSGDKQQAALEPKALAGVIDTLGRGASEALVKMQKLAVQQRELDKKIAAAERDLARMQSGAKDTRDVTVRLAPGKGGAVSLSYQLDNAGWKPNYRAGLDSAASSVDLERLATISQQTGEDWSNVKLTLSTSEPRLSPVGVTPRPWLLNYRPPQEANMLYRAAVPMPAPAPVVQKSGAVTVGGSRIAMEEVVEVQETFATEFEVPGTVSLASGGRAISVVLSKQTLAARQLVRVTPRYEKFGVVMAETARPEGVWPAGNIQLFRDGSYIGATRWDLQDAARAQFSFGRDDLLKVSVEPVEGMSGSKGLFGGRSSRHTADVFTLSSRHKTPVEVLVLESSPVAASEEIKVQTTFLPAPSVEGWEDKRGVVAWKQTLAPNASAKIKVEYRIDYPKEGALSGMR